MKIIIVCLLVICTSCELTPLTPIRYYVVINKSESIVETARVSIIDSNNTVKGSKVLALQFENILPGDTSVIGVLDFRGLSEIGEGNVIIDIKKKEKVGIISRPGHTYKNFVVDYDFPGTKKFNTGVIWINKLPNNHNIECSESYGVVKKGKLVEALELNDVP